MPPKRSERQKSRQAAKKRRTEPLDTVHASTSGIEASPSVTPSPTVNRASIVSDVIEALEKRGVITCNNTSSLTAPTEDVSDASVTAQVRQTLFDTQAQVGSSSGTSDFVHLHSNSLPLGALIPEKVKLAIWNREYIDLLMLLDRRSNADEVTVKFSATGTNVSLTSKDTVKTQPSADG